MKIDSIFDKKLFAIRYKGEKQNELRRLLNLWNDMYYLHQFIKENIADKPKNITIENLISQISDNANEIDDALNELSMNTGKSLDSFFKPLDNNEYRLDIILSKQKARNNYLRIYAIKVFSNCYMITGGAIKFTLKMPDRPHTKKELIKIEQCKNYLKENGVIDDESFFEFLTETT
jgi:hypothetical protein